MAEHYLSCKNLNPITFIGTTSFIGVLAYIPSLRGIAWVTLKTIAGQQKQRDGGQSGV
jgi:hypothetical protein